MFYDFWKSHSHKLFGLVWLTLCLTLNGCSTTSETFECKAGKGVGCKSISEVNQMVDHGTMGDGVEKGMQSRPLPFSSSVISPDHPVVDHSANKASTYQDGIPLSDALSVHRVPEQHMRVWIAPYQDAQGNLHEGSIVHTVVKPCRWQMSSSVRRPLPSASSNLSAKIIDVPDDNNEISLKEDE